MLKNIIISVCLLTSINTFAFHGNPHVSTGGGWGGGGGGYGHPGGGGGGMGGYTASQINQLAPRAAAPPRPVAPAAPPCIIQESKEHSLRLHYKILQLAQDGPVNPCRECRNPSCNTDFVTTEARRLRSSLVPEFDGWVDSSADISLEAIERAVSARQLVHTTAPPLSPEEALRVERRKQADDIVFQVERLNKATTKTMAMASGPRAFREDLKALITTAMNTSKNLSDNAARMIIQNQPTSRIKIVKDLALDSSAAIYDFTRGLVHGANVTAQNIIITPLGFANAVWQNPTVLAHLSENIMNAITSGELIDRAGTAFNQYQLTMLYGTAYERGVATGELGANMMLIAIGGSAIRVETGIAAVPGDLTALGQRLMARARTSPSYATRIAATDASYTAMRELRIVTPREIAEQGLTTEAIAARARVTEGTTLYRTGMRGRSNTGAQAQFWSLENPSSPGYNSRYGIPPGNVSDPDFIETAVIRSDAQFVTRPAPADPSGVTTGGGIEVVVPEGGVTIQAHTSM